MVLSPAWIWVVLSPACRWMVLSPACRWMVLSPSFTLHSFALLNADERRHNEMRSQNSSPYASPLSSLSPFRIHL
jgi:hypothetical protein